MRNLMETLLRNSSKSDPTTISAHTQPQGARGPVTRDWDNFFSLWIIPFPAIFLLLLEDSSEIGGLLPFPL